METKEKYYTSEQISNEFEKLTKDEKKKLVLFLQALTDTSAVVHFSGQLPAIDDSASPLNKRIAGGTD